MVYNRIDNEPFVDSIAKQIAQFAQAQTVVSGYLAFGSSSSYRNHWDTRDVFAVQLIGKKHWTISAPNFDMPLYMQQAKDMPHITPPKTVDMEVILEAGDILYIPRGWW
ncbi:cupin domain-containing protein, partial [Enterobacter hormaechei subsp. steigerwaltii]|nr:cupin domain-containing protein [Enterobacter hormaechei subsp. steigerwaltii]